MFNSPPLSENIPVEDVSFDEIIPEKVPTLNDIKLPKTKEQWLQADVYLSAMSPYSDNNIRGTPTNSIGLLSTRLRRTSKSKWLV